MRIDRRRAVLHADGGHRVGALLRSGFNRRATIGLGREVTWWVTGVVPHADGTGEGGVWRCDGSSRL